MHGARARNEGAGSRLGPVDAIEEAASGRVDGNPVQSLGNELREANRGEVSSHRLAEEVLPSEIVGGPLQTEERELEVVKVALERLRRQVLLTTQRLQSNT